MKTGTKTFKLDLSAYQVKELYPKVDDKGKVVKDDAGRPVMLEKDVDYPIRGNLSIWLRMCGMFKTAVDVAEAVTLAKHIRDCVVDFVVLDEKEKSILTEVLDKLLVLTANGQANIGGTMHEEMICRVVNMEEIVE